MSDIMLDEYNDILIVGGDIVLITTKERMTYQRLLNKLRTFTGGLWTNENYGVDKNLLFKRTSKEIMDNHYASLIINTKGITELVELVSDLNPSTRRYSLTFKAKTEYGDIIGLKDLEVDREGQYTPTPIGIWHNGRWLYGGLYSNSEIWGSR